MHGPQSWEIRVVCLIWVQKCINLAHSIRLELELLRHKSFVTEWRGWLLCIIAILWYWEDGQRSLPKEQAIKIEWQTRLSGPSYFWMKWRKNVQVETLPIDRNGACFYWNECSIMLQLCCVKSIRGTPEDSHWNQLRQLPEHPSVWTLIGSWDSNLLWVTEQIYKVEYVVASSVFTSV